MNGKLRVYGCGGCGVNIASIYKAGNAEDGSASVHPIFVDTSRSNLIKAGIVSDDNVFILKDQSGKDKDGGGKIRRDNSDDIAKNVRALLQQFEPLDFNVVVFSTSGASGSVFGPLIIAELLAREASVIAIVVGSSESAITAKNTVATLKSLESQAKNAGLPIVMHYGQNSPDVKMSEVDHRARLMIGGLAYLVSGDNHGLDSRDLRNWVQFQRTTDIKPCLATVDFYITSAEANKVTNPISVASLYASPDDRDLTIIPDYDCYGIPNTELEVLKATKGIHYVIGTDEIPSIYAHVTGILSDIDQRRKSRVGQESLIKNSDDVDDNGMVF